MGSASSQVKAKEEHSKKCPLECAVCKKSIDKALTFLAKQVDSNNLGQFNALNSAIAGMVFMADGSRHNKGKYKDQIVKCWHNVLQEIDNLKTPDTSAKSTFLAFNVEFALEALFLAEIHKYSPGDKSKTALEKIAKYFEKGIYTDSKGWGYRFSGKKSSGNYTDHNYANMFSTHAVITALSQMRDAGIKVNKDLVAGGIKYMLKLKRSHSANDPLAKRDGEFVYYDTQQKADSRNYSPGGAGRTAGVIYALVRDDKSYYKKLKKSLDYLDKNFTSDHRYPSSLVKLPQGEVYDGDTYNILFLALAMQIQGKEKWDKFWNHFRDTLLKKQKSDGSWDDKALNKVGPCYFTAVHALVMLLPKNNLPLMGELHKTLDLK